MSRDLLSGISTAKSVGYLLDRYHRRAAVLVVRVRVFYRSLTPITHIPSSSTSSSVFFAADSEAASSLCSSEGVSLPFSALPTVLTSVSSLSSGSLAFPLSALTPSSSLFGCFPCGRSGRRSPTFFLLTFFSVRLATVRGAKSSECFAVATFFSFYTKVNLGRSTTSTHLF